MTAAERRKLAYLERLDAGTRAVVEEEALDGSLQTEIGSLRAVLVRLLAEVEDPVVLSLAVARVVNAQARSLSVQRAISGEKAGDVIEALNRVLADLGLGEG